MTIGISAVHNLLPQQRVAVSELPEMSRFSDEEREFATTSGVRTVGVFPETTAAELASRACRELLETHPTSPDVLLLVGSRAPDVLIGSDVCRVHSEAGVDSPLAFTVDGLGCAGSSAAWALARDLLLADPNRESVMIAFASRPTGADRIRYPVTVIGDGACAMTLSRGGRPVLRAHRQDTDGSFHDLFYVDYKRVPWSEWREECRSSDRYSFELAVHSKRQLSSLVDGVLADVGASKEDVAATVMQNVTSSAYEFYEQALGLPIHRVCGVHLGEYGHLGAMDVVLNLERVVSVGGLERGDLVLVLNNSPVATWTATVWEV